MALELLCRRQLLPVGGRLEEYEARVHSLGLLDMTGGHLGGGPHWEGRGP